MVRHGTEVKSMAGRFEAQCECDWKGPLRTWKHEADADAKAHRTDEREKASR